MKFEYHQIDEFLGQMGETALVDVDICTKAWHGGLHLNFENKLISRKTR